MPVTPDVILGHLQGRHVIGVYPMLTDETCWFLAADFDKACWREDVLAFTETCRQLDVPYAEETIAMGAAACGQVIGVQSADTGEDDTDARPWLRSPPFQRTKSG